MYALLVNTGMRLNPADALLIQTFCSYAVLLGILEQAVNHGQILLRGGNNDLAGVLIVNTILCRKCFHAARALRTNLGFQSAAVVVDAAMQHATVAAQGEQGYRSHIHRDVQRQTGPEQPAGHVLHISPHTVCFVMVLWLTYYAAHNSIRP